MAINNFLIVGVTPANNETLVATNTEITIKFAKFMKEESLVNISLFDAEQKEVPITRNYESSEMLLTLKPTSNLLEETVYTVVVKGTATGVISLTNDYLGYAKEYSFTTRKEVALAPPSDFKVNNENRFLLMSWVAPESSEKVSYNFVVSTYNQEIEVDTLTEDILNQRVYPEGVMSLSDTSFDIPKRFNEGTYYIYLQAFTESSKSVYTKLEVIVNKENEPIDDDDDLVFGDFDIVQTLPYSGEVNNSPEEIIIMFNQKVDYRTIDSNSIYVLKEKNKSNLTVMDYMTKYNSNKQLESELLFETNPASNLIRIKLEFENNTDYTVVVTKDVKSVDGQSLGIDYNFGFISEYEYLYGSLELIKNDLSGFDITVSDETILKYMNENSVYAHEIVSKSSNYNATDYQDGKAPYYVHQFVRYKTDYDLILGLIVREASGSGKSITLGDLTVNKDDSVSSLYDILDKFLDMLKGFEDELNGESERGKARAVMVVRGMTSADGDYPDFMDREEFRELGE